MNKIGETFKKIRISRNLTLKEVANGDFSVSMLSKFENGKTEISVDKFNNALSNLHMTVNEFYYFVNDLQYDKFKEVFFKSEKFKNTKNIEGLRNLYNKEIELSQKNELGKFNILNSIAIASYIRDFDKDIELNDLQKSTLYDYLFNTEIWSEYEMDIFTHAMEFFNAKVYLNYAREMLVKTDFLKNNYRIKNSIQIALIHGMFLSIEQDYEFGARYFNEKAYENIFILNTRDAYMKIIYKIAYGFYKIYLGDIKEGKETIEQSLDILKVLGYIQQYDYYLLEYKKILEDIKSENK